jgi:hypothetical protein
MRLRLPIRSSTFLLALNLALAVVVGFSFVRPIGLRFSRDYHYVFMGSKSIEGFNCGIAFHEGGLVIFREVLRGSMMEEGGVHFLRGTAEDLRGLVYGTMHPAYGYSTATLGVQFGVHNPIWGSVTMVIVPFWMVLLVVGMPLGRRLISRFVKYHRAAKGCCVRCGYYLRASESRCPECGAGGMMAGGARTPLAKDSGGQVAQRGISHLR